MAPKKGSNTATTATTTTAGTNKGGSKSHSTKGEVLQFRSPAEFFAENQNIAGFDNVRIDTEKGTKRYRIR